MKASIFAVAALTLAIGSFVYADDDVKKEDKVEVDTSKNPFTGTETTTEKSEYESQDQAGTAETKKTKKTKHKKDGSTETKETTETEHEPKTHPSPTH